MANANIEKGHGSIQLLFAIHLTLTFPDFTNSRRSDEAELGVGYLFKIFDFGAAVALFGSK